MHLTAHIRKLAVWIGKRQKEYSPFGKAVLEKSVNKKLNNLIYVFNSCPPNDKTCSNLRKKTCKFTKMLHHHVVVPPFLQFIGKYYRNPLRENVVEWPKKPTERSSFDFVFEIILKVKYMQPNLLH